MVVGRTNTYERAQPMLARPRGPHSLVQIHDVCAATDASPRTGSVAPETIPHGLGRTFSPAHSRDLAVRGCVVSLPRVGHYPAGPTRASRGLSFHPGLAPIFGCAATFNSLGRELGGDTAQDCAESLGFAASIVGVRHAQQHGEVDDQEGVPAFQGCGNAN